MNIFSKKNKALLTRTRICPSFRGRGEAGLTLIESIVSIALLSMAVAGPMTLAAHSIKAAGSARNEMIATHLAEEGLEIVHSMRDNLSADDNSPTRAGWMTFFANCDEGGGCVVDAVQRSVGNPAVWNTVAPLPLQECISCALTAYTVYVNPATGFYRQQLSGPLGAPFVPTSFQRAVFLSSTDGATRQVHVTAIVAYPGYGGQTQMITISEDLFNWFPNIQ